MTGPLRRVPLPVLLAGTLAASMYLPAIHASVTDAHAEARAFFYSATLLLALLAALGVATARRASSNVTRSHLLALFAAFTVLPAMAALPLWQIVADTRFLNTYVEMVAAMTTTGGSLYAPERLGESVHLWRAMVAWQGGLVVWVAAIAILAPLNLGGFEVSEGNPSIRPGLDPDRTRDRTADPEMRVVRAVQALLPTYVALTFLLWGILVWLGEGGTTALIHAMSTLSTSGITDGTGLADSAAAIPGEMAVALFLVFALSRQTFTTDMNAERIRNLGRDRELRIAGLIVLVVTAALFARHWIGAFEVDAIADTGAAFGALWGSAFTVLSFLTTTGFESAHWQQAQDWSGLGTPTVLLLGLAVFGGGVATTAGGVKLLRIYTLYEHGRREMNLLVHPSSVVGGKGALGRIPKGGIEGAWVFFMLFATSIAGVTLLMTLAGLDFEGGLALAVACLTTTGPLAEMVLGGQGALNALPDPVKIIAALTMVLGRLETLALIALLNPDFWRD
ncbi:TrkH family potassium uptake protein [Jannaschia sp. S6380]|uniref:TrkH family potassium uptake protein n=1 Tax=Jannaschia sp. S6380 TaxID=2926408 RepID=UPI001FF4A65F|nr:potassium transporter TrkG [Jannaschia sp. S6380]MCK0166579.1 TrkH family potassium uptake protein [Jannaschia sp. S6380]